MACTASDAHRSSNPFDTLPPELKQEIISLLPNVSSVKSAMMTCASLYHAFHDAEPLILTRVLQKQIHPDIAFEALLSYKTWLLDQTFKALDEPWDTDAVRDVLRSYNGNRSPSLRSEWVLRNALFLSNLHEQVEFFSQRFASSALSIDLTGAPFSSYEAQPSAGEIHRIQRTFYRFEIYCNLFRLHERKGRYGPRNLLRPSQRICPREQQRILFEQFPPWENEQLACIRDYLINQVSVPFNDVAAHCIEWAKFEWDEYDYLDDWESLGVKEFLLSRGLGYIRQLITADTFSERLKLLDSRYESDDDFLYAALEARPSGHYAQKLCDYSEQQLIMYLDQFRAADIDHGPRKAWSWAHFDNDVDTFYNDLSRGHRFLRIRGYVMWDLARWERWGALDEVWQENPPAEYDPERDYGVDYGRQCEEMRESFRVRHEICKRGGRGWWASNDESRIQWPGGQVPKDWPSKPKDAKVDLKQAIATLEKMRRAQPQRRELPSDYQGWVDFFKQRNA